MRVERRPYSFDVHAEFPNARLFKAWEGGGAFKAERDGKPFIITDGRTILEFLDDTEFADPEASNVSVIEFEDEAERDAWIAREMPFGTDLENRI